MYIQPFNHKISCGFIFGYSIDQFFIKCVVRAHNINAFTLIKGLPLMILQVRPNRVYCCLRGVVDSFSEDEATDDPFLDVLFVPHWTGWSHFLVQLFILIDCASLLPMSHL